MKYKYKLKENNLSHHMSLGDDWGEIISILEKYGTPDQIDNYIKHCKENNIDFEYSQDFIVDFKQWLDSQEIDETSTSGGAGGYLTKYAFKLPKKQKEIKEEVDEKDKWQKSRIEVFDNLELRLENIKKLLRQGKLKTNRYYRENPDSYEVVVGTDLITEYFNDIETLLK